MGFSRNCDRTEHSGCDRSTNSGAQFDKAQGVFAKTEKIDARLFAEYCVMLKPEVKALPDDKVRRVKDILARKWQLNEMRTREFNRSHRTQKITAASHRQLIKLLDKVITETKVKLANEVADIREWQRTNDIISSISGDEVQQEE